MTRLWSRVCRLLASVLVVGGRSGGLCASVVRWARAAGLLALLALSVAGCDEPSRRAAPDGIGEVDTVVRLVRATLANQPTSRLLAADDAVYWRELIETGTDSATELQFIDGTLLSVGPDARVVLDEFVYGGPAGTDRMVLTVTKGLSRFITGRMEKAAYEIRAPGAIIGVRGTDFTIAVDPDAGTTTVLVHQGEVAFKRSDGGVPVLLRPGEASRVTASRPRAITPPSPPPPDIVRGGQRLQGMIREARAAPRREGRSTEKAAARSPAREDPRMAAFRPDLGERQPLADLARQVRTLDTARPAGMTAPAGAPAVGQPAMPPVPPPPGSPGVPIFALPKATGEAAAVPDMSAAPTASRSEAAAAASTLTSPASAAGDSTAASATAAGSAAVSGASPSGTSLTRGSVAGTTTAGGSRAAASGSGDALHRTSLDAAAPDQHGGRGSSGGEIDSSLPYQEEEDTERPAPTSAKRSCTGASCFSAPPR